MTCGAMVPDAGSEKAAGDAASEKAAGDAATAATMDPLICHDRPCLVIVRLAPILACPVGPLLPCNAKDTDAACGAMVSDASSEKAAGDAATAVTKAPVSLLVCLSYVGVP